MLRLPPELLDIITTALWSFPQQDRSPSSNDPRRRSAKHDLEVRLVCRELNNATFPSFAKAFFNKISVIFTRRSLDRLHNISQYERLAAAVVKLDVGSYRLCSPYTLHRPSVIDLDDDHSFSLAASIACENRFSLLNGFPRETVRKAMKYRDAWIEQYDRDLQQQDAPYLAQILGKFPKLREVQVRALGRVHWHEGEILPEECYDSDSAAAFLPITSTNATITATKVMEAICKAAHQNPSFRLEKLTFKPTSNLPNGRVSDKHSVQLHNIALPPTCPSPTHALAYLKEIKLAISHQANSPHRLPQDAGDGSRLMGILMSSKLLEVLHLDFGADQSIKGKPCISNALVATLFRIDNFLRLRDLRLTGCNIAHSPHIAMFLTNHAATLERLSLRMELHWVPQGTMAGESTRAWIAVWRGAALSQRLTELNFELDVGGEGVEFHWAGREKVAASTNRLANGLSMVDEAKLWLGENVLSSMKIE